MRPSKAFAREEALFVAAVLVGSVTGLIAEQLLLRWVGQAAAGNVALALATTLTGATHARLVHRHSIGSLLPSVAVGAPLAYVVMRVIHALVGS
jgi:hypothetical protein